MLLKITLPLVHVNVSPRTESGWTRKNPDCCRANTDDRAGSRTPSKLRKISTSETSPVDVATKTARKYTRMYHTRSPLSAIARGLLLNKLHVGESSPSSVDLSSRFQCILELARAETPEVNVEHMLGAMDCRVRAPRTRNYTSRKFKFSNMLDFAVYMRCMPSRRLRRLDKPLVPGYGGSSAPPPPPHSSCFLARMTHHPLFARNNVRV